MQRYLDVNVTPPAGWECCKCTYENMVDGVVGEEFDPIFRPGVPQPACLGGTNICDRVKGHRRCETCVYLDKDRLQYQRCGEGWTDPTAEYWSDTSGDGGRGSEASLPQYGSPAGGNGSEPEAQRSRHPYR
ncbi:hypothetical protein ONS95_001559 [Cadophora gregata]|uniref:uncharacterized protein n=1 Tax=Cadophora gregata TaxID=51156 RepID=UPI0026DB71D8|nr:uncharacterized protein ONS95_001559 [Cadophora gregata]KAK0111183.1 hypothetical protein ONS95_001559 [Cadophora gregata]KAK0112346.1 hypothetical protein ONS96_001593 [Cadophora gregata f. sp. sojae]